MILNNRHTKATKAFPTQIRKAVEFAMAETSQRNEDGFQSGRLDSGEAIKAQNMINEMRDGLCDMARGRAKITDRGETRGGREYFLETPSKDKFRVVVRDKRSKKDQARIGIKEKYRLAQILSVF